MDTKAAVLEQVCQNVDDGHWAKAAQTLKTQLPFEKGTNGTRRYDLKIMMTIFDRDGFIDRYSGRRLVFPGTLRLLSEYFREEFPYHTNWKIGECHLSYYELYPTVDHINPVKRDDGTNDLSNLVSTSQLLNSAKSHFTLSELGWKLHEPGDIHEWDGLTEWFLERAESDPKILESKPMNGWYKAAKLIRAKRSKPEQQQTGRIHYHSGQNSASAACSIVHGQDSGTSPSASPISFRAWLRASSHTSSCQSGLRMTVLRLGVSLIASAIRRRWSLIVARQEFDRFCGLNLPFEEMCQQHRHAIGQLALFAFAHVLDLVGQMFNVEFVEPAGA